MSAFAKVLLLLKVLLLSIFLPYIASSSVLKVESTNSSNMTQGCIPTLSQSAMKSILELMSDEITHVIDLKIWIESANNSLNKTQELTGIKWANEIGRTLITLAAKAAFSDKLMLLSYTSTMKAGHHDVNIVITEETMQCLFSRDNTSDHAIFDLLVHELHQNSGSKTDYKLCLPFKKQDQVTNYKCCTIFGPNDILICSDYSSIVTKIFPILLLITLVFFFSIAFPIVWEYLNQFKESDTHYRISNSPMSISYILHSVLIQGYESGKSSARKLMLGIFVLVTTLPEHGALPLVYLLLISLWGFFLFTDVIRYDEKRLVNLTKDTFLHKTRIKQWHDLYVKRIWRRCFSKTSESKKTEKTPLIFTPHEENKPHGFIEICKTTFCLPLKHLIFFPFLLVCYLTGIVISFLWTCFVLVKNIMRFPQFINSKPADTSSRTALCLIFLINSLNISIIVYSIVNLLSLVFYLIIGLFLNAEIYSPYILPLCTIVFYSWTKWRSAVETKYLVLLTNIYKVCKESCEDSDECTNNITENSGTFSDRSLSTSLLTIESNDEGEPIISKELYDRVREQILPYHRTLFDYYKGVFFIAVFGYLLYILMSLGQKSGISGSVQIIGTIAASSLPFIIDFVWKNKSDEQKEVDSIAMNSKLKRILLVRRKEIITVEFRESSRHKKSVVV